MSAVIQHYSTYVFGRKPLDEEDVLRKVAVVCVRQSIEASLVCVLKGATILVYRSILCYKRFRLQNYRLDF
jgi:hypothetical protein